MASSSLASPIERSPSLVVRWLRPQTATALLDLPTAPIALSTQKEVPWQAFTAEESEACEAAWQALSDEDKRRSEGYGVGSETASEKSPSVEEEVEDEDTVGVSIARDKLFEVDVRRMKLRPIYWKMNTPQIPVTRATWMYDEHKPVSKAHAATLEEFYQGTRPWTESYNIELTTALDLGMDAHEKLRLSLDDQYYVIFENAERARLILKNGSKSIFSSFLPVSSSTATLSSCYPYSILVYRGYDAAVSASEAATRSSLLSYPVKEETPSSIMSDTAEGDMEDLRVTPSKEESRVKRADSVAARPKKRGRAGDWDRSPTPVGNEDEGEVTDLILIIHGIGQGLATQYEGFNFIYAANLFRQVARKQSMLPAVASIMRNRRVQFLPVQWRSSFNLDAVEERRREEAGLDNEFTLSDITIKQSVTYVRDLMNNVLIDIPYFMSHHRQAMVQAVVAQANRIYRLWCARNPGFDKYGRVHIIAHSLGSSLATNILSNQPTIQPPLSEMDAEYVKSCKELFLFNTSCLFMVGSPVPVFFHINRSQLIARKGRERTMKSPPDEALDEVGRFGCLAVDSIYNIFNPSDPVAYLLNPCVDAKKAKELPPSVIRNTTTPLFTSFSSRVSKMFSNPFSRSPRTPSPGHPASPRRQDSGFELGGQTETLLGSREERRFAALNPYGTLDFTLPSEGTISDYVDMITAHSAYWADPNLAAFILAEILARKEDLARTGLGLERAPRSVPSTLA